MVNLQEALYAFKKEKKFSGKGSICVALVITQQAIKLSLPLDPEKLLTDGRGQVLGLNRIAVQAVLAKHGISRVLAAEGGRTSRGSINNMHEYVCFLNTLAESGPIDLDAVEEF